MIDLHCHLLPGIDDGPATLEESLELARIAVHDGITHSIVTPHIHPGRYDNSVTSITPVFLEFQQELSEHKIPLQLLMGAELRISAEMLAMIPAQQIPFIGSWNNNSVILLELPHSHIPPGSEKLVDWLLAQNILPMIAHPERNKEIMRNLNKLAPFIERGCLFQLTAMSITGQFGTVAEQRSLEILEQGWATVIATDAHNKAHRPPILSEGLKVAADIIGVKEAVSLVADNPARILGILT